MRAIFRWLREGVIGLDSTRSISGRLGMRYNCGMLLSIMSNGLLGAERGLKVLIPHFDPTFVSVKRRFGFDCYLYVYGPSYWCNTLFSRRRWSCVMTAIGIFAISESKADDQRDVFPRRICVEAREE